MKNNESSDTINKQDGKLAKHDGKYEFKEDSKCPVCLSEIEDVTFAINCNHEFCFDCIEHWVQQRNRCPVCRQVIHSIRHQVRGESGGWEERDVPVRPNPETSQAYIINFEFFTLVQTAEDGPMFVIQPVRLRGVYPTFRYILQMLDQDHIYYLTNVRPGTMFVAPENLIQVLEILEGVGITRYEVNQHQFEIGQHPSMFRRHLNHRLRKTQPPSIPRRQFDR